MNRRSICLALFCMATMLLHAKLYVYNITGSAQMKRAGEWSDLYKTCQLTETDSIKTDRYSSLVILDDSRQTLYTVQTTEAVTVKSIVSQKEHTVSLLKEAFSGIMQAMRKDNSKSMEHYQMRGGVTYRGDDEDRTMAMLLTAKCSGNLQSVQNYQTDYPIHLRLIDTATGDYVSGAAVGSVLIAEVENLSSSNLYVNLIDIDTEGNTTILFPHDEEATMLHLIVPAGSTIRFTDFPFTLYEPIGTDQLVITAFSKPYNLQHVLQLMPLNGSASGKIGLFKTHLTIQPQGL